ncbi:MAG: enoyl-CoA hydratase, partial [Rhodospirillaceae bacterium]|nr:enoyl-CoA hydratase [Rhodospirillaceae bacterium]
MSYETIIYERRDRVALITLNRPAKLNAWTVQLRDEIVAAIAKANDDAGVGAIVVTGAGRGFCAG